MMMPAGGRGSVGQDIADRLLPDKAIDVMTRLARASACCPKTCASS